MLTLSGIDTEPSVVQWPSCRSYGNGCESLIEGEEESSHRHQKSGKLLIRVVLAMIFALTTLAKVPVASATILAGVTIKSPPFVQTEGNRFSGLCVDLLDEIERRTGLKYSLYLVGDGLYGPGRMVGGRMTGMVGDLHTKKADFAIGDLTVTSFRERYINFTEPFFTFSFSALVRRSLAGNLRTLDDLAIKSNLSVGAFANSNTLLTLERLRSVNIRTIRWLHNRIVDNDTANLVNSREEALARVRSQPYAFIQEEPKNLYLASRDCSLTVLTDPTFYLFGRYAIAFRPDSPYLPIFSQTIAKLSNEGYLDRLRRKYFEVGCLRNAATDHHHHLGAPQTLVIALATSIAAALFGTVRMAF